MSSASIRRLVLCLTHATVVVTAVGCGPHRRGADQPLATVMFTNESIDQATVYVVAPGADFRRIGTVIPGRTETLTVPADFTNRGTVNFVARLLARSEVPQTGPVSVLPGERYVIRLQLDGRVLSFLPAGS